MSFDETTATTPTISTRFTPTPSVTKKDENMSLKPGVENLKEIRDMFFTGDRVYIGPCSNCGEPQDETVAKYDSTLKIHTFNCGKCKQQNRV